MRFDPAEPVRPPAPLDFLRMRNVIVEGGFFILAYPVLIFACCGRIHHTGDVSRPGEHETQRSGKMLRYFPDAFRSEEHTSELQSLMRISYAVFCLKNKKKPTRKEVAVRESDPKNIKLGGAV